MIHKTTHTIKTSTYLTTVTRKVVTKALHRVRKYIAPLLSHESLTVEGLEKIFQQNELGELEWFIECQRHAPRIAPHIEFDLLRVKFPERFPEALEGISKKANQALVNRFSELGSDYVDLSDGDCGIRWNEDFKTGAVWPQEHYLRTKVVQGNGSDIKIVWELSRFQFGVSLAQMEALTGSALYRHKFIELVDDWQRKNPYPLGPNWNCAMEVAIRAINLLQAIETFNRHSALPLEFLKSVYTSLYQHGKHIFENLENSGPGLNTNHYLADLIGLLTIGELFEALPEGAKWRTFAVAELEKEIIAQTTEDGFCYESSSAYHLLTLEFYLYAYTFARKNKIALSIVYTRRLAQSLEITAAVTMPNGKLPNIGDNDSGRLFKFFERQDLDPAWLLLWGRLEGLYTAPGVGKLRQSAESIWMFGFKEATKARTLAHTKAQSHKSKFHRAMGLAFMRHDDLALSVNVSNIGVNGVGGHKHNDQLALTLCWGNDEVIVDPGMYCYTSDIKERNRLRSVHSHSTIAINGDETDRFLQGFPFALRRDGSVVTDTWLSTVELDLLKASHSCYSRFAGAPEISRTIYFDKLTRFFLVRDEILQKKIAFATDSYRLESALIISGTPKFADSATVKIDLAGSDEKNVTIRCYTPGVTMSAERFVWSPEYGVKKTGSRLSVLANAGITEIIWGMFLNYADERKQDSETLIFEKMRLLHWPTAELRRSAESSSHSDKHMEPVV